MEKVKVLTPDRWRTWCTRPLNIQQLSNDPKRLWDWESEDQQIGVLKFASFWILLTQFNLIMKTIYLWCSTSCLAHPTLVCWPAISTVNTKVGASICPLNPISVLYYLVKIVVACYSAVLQPFSSRQTRDHGSSARLDYRILCVNPGLDCIQRGGGIYLRQAVRVQSTSSRTKIWKHAQSEFACTPV